MKKTQTTFRHCMVFIVLISLAFHVHAYSQQINLSVHAGKLKDVLKDVRKQSGYDFVYTNAVLEAAAPIDVQVNDATIEGTLAALFKGQPLRYTIDGKTIIIEVRPLTAGQRTVTGRVVDADNGSPLSGVSVRIKGSAMGTATDVDGRFSIAVPADDAVLVVSSMGYAQHEVTVGNQTSLAVELRQTQQELGCSSAKYAMLDESASPST